MWNCTKFDLVRRDRTATRAGYGRSGIFGVVAPMDAGHVHADARDDDELLHVGSGGLRDDPAKRWRCGPRFTKSTGPMPTHACRSDAAAGTSTGLRPPRAR